MKREREGIKVFNCSFFEGSMEKDYRSISKLVIHYKMSNYAIKKETVEEIQNGRKVRCGDNLPHHKYIRNTSTCGTMATEHLLNAGRRPQISQKARNSPSTWVGQKKKEKTETTE